MPDFKHLSVEILRAYRGHHSMLWLSRRLGYSHNQVYLWESGRREFHWRDFENLCQRFRRPLHSAIEQYFVPEGSTDIGSLIRHSLKSGSKKEILKKFSISPSKLSRWQTGKSSPPFAEACEMLNFTKLNFLEFLDHVLGPGVCLSIQPALQQKRKAKKTLYQTAYLAALAPAVELKKYMNLKRHRPGVLARLIGITDKQEADGLRILTNAGITYLENGTYKLNTYRLNVTDDPNEFLKIADYWSKRAAEFRKTKGSKSLFGYRVFGISESGLKRLKQALFDYYDEITEILKDEQNEFDHIVAIPFQTLVLDESYRG
jgi:transcriptional regulator with XRE-family HTH domain